MSNQLGRLTQQILTNKSGAGVAYGDVVVIDTANANAFTTTTSLQYVTTPIGVCIEPNGIGNNAQGMIAFGGAIGKIALDTAASIGDWIHTFTVAGQGHPHAAPADTGDFAVALEASSTPKALLIALSGGGGSAATDVRTIALTLTNQTGGSVSQGDVVFLQDNIASSFDNEANLAIARGDARYVIGVMLDTTIGIGASGKVALYGYAPKIALSAAAGSAGQYVHAKGSAAQGELSRYEADEMADGGAFALTLDAGSTPPAFLWNPPTRPAEIKLATVTGIDMNTAAATVLYTNPAASMTVIITRVVCRNASANLTTASWSFGYNAANYDDVIANANHTELASNSVFTVLLAKAGAKAGLVGSGTFRINVQTPQGVAATLDCDVYGYLVY